MTKPARRMLPPAWLLLALVASYALDRWFPVVEWLARPWNYLGFVPIAFGALISISSATAFRRAGTPVVPFEPSTTLVTGGWYRVTRNPMYLGLSLVLLGVGLLGGSLGGLLPLPVFVAILQWRFIAGEERFMEGIFGEQYLAYKARVRRWL